MLPAFSLPVSKVIAKKIGVDIRTNINLGGFLKSEYSATTKLSLNVNTMTSRTCLGFNPFFPKALNLISTTLLGDIKRQVRFFDELLNGFIAVLLTQPYTCS